MPETPLIDAPQEFGSIERAPPDNSGTPLSDREMAMFLAMYTRETPDDAAQRKMDNDPMEFLKRMGYSQETFYSKELDEHFSPEQFSGSWEAIYQYYQTWFDKQFAKAFADAVYPDGPELVKEKRIEAKNSTFGYRLKMARRRREAMRNKRLEKFIAAHRIQTVDADAPPPKVIEDTMG